MGEKDEINRADKIDNRRRRTGQAKRPAPQTRENSLGRWVRQGGHARVMATERMQTMRVRCSNQWLTELLCDPGGTSVRVQESFVKVAILDRIEAIHLRNQSVADRSA